jgi:4'-phosphopantetheinyl transferase EntD
MTSHNPCMRGFYQRRPPPRQVRSHSVKISGPTRNGSPIIDANPATLSPRLQSLFPPGALAAELAQPGDPASLFPEEAAFLGSAVAERAQQFAAGRACARRLLAEFGILDFPIKVAENRQPLWPEALVGSITHTNGFCAAVVAERTRICALGLDSEIAGRVRRELWRHICAADEINWLESLPESSRCAAATTLFSAKEAFYKCQYPLARQWLYFHDVRVELPAWGDARGTFLIHPTRDIAFSAHTEFPLQGRYVFHEQFVTTGLAAISRPCHRETL